MFSAALFPSAPNLLLGIKPNLETLKRIQAREAEIHARDELRGGISISGDVKAFALVLATFANITFSQNLMDVHKKLRIYVKFMKIT